MEKSKNRSFSSSRRSGRALNGFIGDSMENDAEKSKNQLCSCFLRPAMMFCPSPLTKTREDYELRSGSSYKRIMLIWGFIVQTPPLENDALSDKKSHADPAETYFQTDVRCRFRSKIDTG